MLTSFRVRLFLAASATAVVVAIVRVIVTGTSDPAASPGDAISRDPDAGDRTGAEGYRPGVDTTWQWQIQGSPNTSYDVTLYDIDLFDTTAETIAALQARGIRVVCYFSAGSDEDWRPDHDAFPAAATGETLAGLRR